MHIRDYLATLDFVNEERARVGLPRLDHLPAGTPTRPGACVIAKALPGAIVAGHNAPEAIVIGDWHRRIPSAVRRFIWEFDAAGDPDEGRILRDAAALVEGGTDDDKGCLVLG